MRRASSEYSRVFTSLTVGVALLATGAIGFDVRNMHGEFIGGRWTTAPVWWQIVVGAVAMFAGLCWARPLVMRDR